MQPAVWVAGQVTVVEPNPDTSVVETLRFVFAVRINDLYGDKLDPFCASALIATVIKMTEVTTRETKFVCSRETMPHILPGVNFDEAKRNSWTDSLPDCTGTL